MLKVNHISKKIGKSTILDDITLTVESGNIYGFQGRNGSGKTMLFRAMAGLINLDRGEVTYNGKKVGENHILQDLGLILENPAFLSGLSGIDNLAMIASIRKIADQKRLEEVLRLVGLEEEANKKYGKYSLGMKAKLALANALMEDPQVLMLDEPTNGIDEQGIEDLFEILKVERDKGKLILIASHEREFLEGISDTIFYMNKGQVIDVKNFGR